MAFPYYCQLNMMDCGPVCQRVIAKYYGRPNSVYTIKGFSGFGKRGVYLLGICDAAQ